MLLFDKFIFYYKNTLKKIFPECLFEINILNFDYNTNQSRLLFGDISSNIALIISKKLKQHPFQIAQLIEEKIKNNEYIEKINIIKPGFINIFFKKSIYIDYININLIKKELITKTTELNRKYNIEFVSANPTGPLHIGHGRNAILGDILQRIFKLKGYEVNSEYYINDTGNQIYNLGKSLFQRYAEKCGQNIIFDENGYCGNYIIDIATELYQKNKDTLINKDIHWFGEYAKKELLEEIKKTLDEYHVNFDNWFSEMTLHKSNEITHAVEALNKKGFIYKTNDNAIWFKATHFGDEKDRVLKKSDGSWTYTAADIAYFLNKINRGYTDIIMILGQDHHSFKIRIEAIAKAFEFDMTRFHVILYQLVTLKNEGEAIRMSKRKGNSICLQDIIDTVGTDVARFFYLHRKADAHLDFDIDIALQKNTDNPVFYIQYSIVRIQSIFNKIKISIEYKEIMEAIMEYTLDDYDKLLLRKINLFNATLNTIIESLEPHILAYYTIELAALFHAFYNRFTIITENDKTTRSRYAISFLTQQTLKECAILLGISIPNNM